MANRALRTLARQNHTTPRLIARQISDRMHGERHREMREFDIASFAGTAPQVEPFGVFKLCVSGEIHCIPEREVQDWGKVERIF